MTSARQATFFAVLVVAGCPREQDAPPQDDAGTSDASAATDTTGAMTTTISSSADTSPVDTGSESSTGADCLGPAGCWSCEPNAPEQLLNRCSDAECEPFDNSSTRLPLLERDGTLPPIP